MKKKEREKRRFPPPYSILRARLWASLMFKRVRRKKKHDALAQLCQKRKTAVANNHGRTGKEMLVVPSQL